ncbi:MAG TPA: hypothetical protein DHW25_01840 [Blautia sp.]|nr:hypothetical protein [Blautia sp.]
MDYGCPTVVPESPAPYHIFISAISIIVFTYIQVKRIMTKKGAPLRASMYATDQMINAGDGGHNHPTQTLIDFMTIRQRKGHLDHLLPKLDVLYMTRVQKEHFFNEEDYVRLKDTYILNQEKLNLAQLDMPVLHPLPRVEEIAVDVDQDPRAAYFDQV